MIKAYRFIFIVLYVVLPLPLLSSQQKDLLSQFMYTAQEQLKTTGTINIYQLPWQLVGVNVADTFLQLVPASIKNSIQLIMEQVQFSKVPIRLHRGQKGVAIQAYIPYSNTKTPVTLIIVQNNTNKLNASLQMALPSSWRFSSDYPVLAKLDELPFTIPQFIFSTFNYTSLNGNHIQKGLNFNAGITLTGPLQTFQNFLRTWIPNLNLDAQPLTITGIIASDPKKTHLSIALPSGHFSLDLQALYQQLSIPIPSSSLTALDLHDWKLNITPATGATQLAARATAHIADHAPLEFDVRGSYQLVHNNPFFNLDGIIKYQDQLLQIKTTMGKQNEQTLFSIGVQLPNGWHFAKDYPALAKLDELSFVAPFLVISNFNHRDKAFGYIKKGLNFNADMNLTGPLKKLETFIQEWAPALNTSTKPLKFSGVITPDIASSQFAIQLPIDITINFDELYKKHELSIPPLFFSSIKLKHVMIDVSPQTLATRTHGSLAIMLDDQSEPLFGYASLFYSPIPKGHQLIAKGSVKYKKRKVATTLRLIKKGIKYPDFSIALDLPKEWKISEEYPVLATFDKLSLLSPQLVFSTYDYRDKKQGIIKKGLNLKSTMRLDDTLRPLQDLAKNIDPSLNVELDQVTLSGVIAPDLTKSTFSFNVPLRITFDLDNLYKEGKLLTQSVFSHIGITNWNVKLSPTDLSPTIMATIEVGITGQKRPLRLNGLVRYTPPSSWVAAGEMLGTWHSAFGKPWLSLSNLALEIGIDPTVTSLAAAVGIPLPINNIGLQGTFAFGSGAERIQTTVAGKLAINPPTTKQPLAIPMLILQGALNRASLHEFILFLSTMLNTPIDVTNIPSINLRDLKVYVAPQAGSIGTTEYPAGLMVQGSMDIGSLSGSLKLDINEQAKRMQAKGSLSNIETPLFSFTGPTPDTHPSFDMIISPEQQKIKAQGKLAIPLIGLSKGVDLSFNKNGLYAKLDSIDLFDTRVDSCEINIPFVDFNQLLIRYTMQSSTVAAIREKVQTTLAVWQENITKEFKQSRNNILHRQNEVKRKLRETYQERNRLKKECDELQGKGLVARVKAGAPCTQYAAKQFDIAFINLGNEFRELAVLLSKEIEKVPKKLLSATGDIIDLATSVAVTNISGSLTGYDLAAGKLPMVSIEVTIYRDGKEEKRTLENVQFDFAHPIDSAAQIADAIIQFFS